MFLANNWKTLVIIAVSVVVTWYVTKGCNHPARPLPDNHKSDSIQKVLDSSQKQWDSIAAFLNKRITEADERNDNIWQKWVHAETARQKITDSLQKLIAQNSDFKKQLDTLGQLTTCDEIITQVQILFDTLAVQRKIIDSLRSTHADQLALKDSVIVGQQNQIEGLRQAFLALKGDYEALVKADRKTLKKAAFQDVVSKISIIAAGILAITLAIKK
jgi:hypothetical protein